MNQTGLSPGGIPPIGLNFTNPATYLRGPSRASQIIAGNLIPEIFASLFFFARVYARGYLIRSWGKDDTFLSISWLGSFILCILSCLSTKYGTGHHIWDIPLLPHRYSIPGLKIGLGGLLLYQCITALTKISICFLYLRIFTDKMTKYIIYSTIAFIALYTIPTLLFSIVQCHPVSAHWDVFHPDRCVNPTPAFYASGVCNVLADVWLIIIVVPRIWNLQMAIRQKIALFIIITLSWLVIIAALVRMVRLGLLFRTRVVDTPWAFYDISIWSGLEVSMGIFCVSAPGIKPVLQHFAPSLLASISNQYSNSRFGAGKQSVGTHSDATKDSRNRWTLKHGGAIELSDRDRNMSFPAFAEMRTSRRIWGRDKDFEKQAHDVDSEKGVLPFMGVEKMEEAGTGEIRKTTTVRIEVDESGKNNCFASGGSKSSLESDEDLEGRSYMKM